MSRTKPLPLDFCEKTCEKYDDSIDYDKVVASIEYWKEKQKEK